MKKVEYESRTIVTFFLPLDAAEFEWRQREDDTVIPESKMDPDECGHLKFADSIAADICWQLFGPAGGDGELCGVGEMQGYLDFCGMGDTLEIDPDVCPYTTESVANALTILGDMFVRGKKFRCYGPVRIGNRGTKDYPDPYPIESKVIVPKAVRNALVRKPGQPGKTPDTATLSEES
jgi:hypothetical protein